MEETKTYYAEVWARAESPGDSGNIRIGIMYPESTYVFYSDWVTLADTEWTKITVERSPTNTGSDGGLAVITDEISGGLLIGAAWAADTEPAAGWPGLSNVFTDTATDIANQQATLQTNFEVGDKNDVDVFFEWREQGTSTWNQTAKTTYAHKKLHTEQLTSLNEQTAYEFRGLVTTGSDTQTGETKTFTTRAKTDATIAITTPGEGDTISSNLTTVSGTTALTNDSDIVTVTVEGETFTTGLEIDHTWSVDVELEQDGTNDIAAGLYDGLVADTVTVTYDRYDFPFGIAPHPVISEFLVDSSGDESDFEFVELYNPIGTAQPLGDWEIQYKSATGSSWSTKATILSGDTIPAYGYYLIGGSQVSPTPDQINTSLGFAGSGGHIRLVDGSGVVIDKVGYGTANDPEGSAVSAPGEDESASRLPETRHTEKGNGQDSNDNETDFMILSTIDPQNTASAAEAPDSSAGTLTVDKSTLYTMDGSLNVTVEDPDRNNQPDTIDEVIVTVTSNADPSGITWTIDENGTDTSVFAGTLGFSLEQSDAANGIIQVSATGDTLTVTYQDPAPYVAQTEQVVYIGKVDLKINEIMYDPNNAEPTFEWFEIVNNSDIPVDLSGWRISDSVAGDSTSTDGYFDLPAGTELSARQFFVLAYDSQAADGNVDEVYGEGAPNLVLENDADTLVIIDPNGNLHDLVPYESSWGGLNSDTANEFSLERVDVFGASDDSSNWANSREDGGTPQEPNSVAVKIVINEIMYDPDGTEPNNEWVEIYNPGDFVIDISGYRLADDGGTYTIPDGTEITAQTYFTLGHSSTAAGGALDLTYGDHSDGTIRLVNTGDTISLMRPDNSVMDRVAYEGSWGGAENESLSRKFADEPSQDYTNWGHSKADGGTPQAKNDVDTIPPTVDHDSVDTAIAGRDIGIHAVITDNQDEEIAAEGAPQGNVKIFYRQPGDSEYLADTMSRIRTDEWNGVIPSDSVTMEGLEYTIWVIDSSNNIGGFASKENPHSVTVIETGPQVFINEFMYDPADSEPQHEFVELYNAGEQTVELGGWTMGTTRDKVTIPEGTTLAAGGYYVLGYGPTAAQGQVDLVYGDTVPGLQFRNSRSAITDQIILTMEGGMVIDEVNYSSSPSEDWGAENTGGPNNVTMERLNHDYALSNDASNWLPSETNDGTPGAENGLHYVRYFEIENDMFDPLQGETTSVTWYQNTPGTATVKVVSIDGLVLRETLYDSHVEAGTYTVTWDGTDQNDSPVVDVSRAEVVVVDDTGQMSIHRINDATIANVQLTSDDRVLFRLTNDLSAVSFLLVKPAYVDAYVKSKSTGETVYTAMNNTPLGTGNQHFAWDGRREDGYFKSEYIVGDIDIINREIFGQPIITSVPAKLYAISVSPRDFFNPLRGDSAAINFAVGTDARVKVEIRDVEGNLVKTIKDGQVPAGRQTFYWDGKDAVGTLQPDGKYLVLVRLKQTGALARRVRSVYIYTP